MISYQTQEEYSNQQEVQYETVTVQQTEGQAQFYIQQAISTAVGENGEEEIQYQYIPITSLNSSNPELQQYYIQQ